jgi:hypothetical protein
MVMVGDRNPDTGKLRFYDAEAAEDTEVLKQQAYDAYEDELTNAWRRDDD